MFTCLYVKQEVSCYGLVSEARLTFFESSCCMVLSLSDARLPTFERGSLMVWSEVKLACLGYMRGEV